MALSMDEQRILDEMERKLADEDPLLASRLTSFGRPALPALMRSRRARIVLSFLALVVIASVSLAVYALTPFRAGFSGRSATTTHVVTKTSAPASGHSASAQP